MNSINTNKIAQADVYAYNEKAANGTLEYNEWNDISTAVATSHAKINSLIDDVANLPIGGGSSEPSTPSNVVSVSSKGNTTISATKHINIEPAYVPGGGSGTYGDVQIKPGDDITLESHHRALDKQDEITIKTSDGKDGSKAPVKLQVIASNVTLSTKGKVVPQGSNDTSEVMNVNVTTGQGKGYLKVRARAIDLRCEEHGGIALQPMGNDGQGHENKVKFEHGGGDGKEFFTMNSEKMSAFTDEYRFNKNGKWLMATRQVLDNTDGAIDDAGNGKFHNGDDETKHYSYEKQTDDFYDIIDNNLPSCTTEDIIQTSHALNGTPGVHTRITDKGNMEIETNEKYMEVAESATADITIDSVVFDPSILQHISSDEAGNIYNLEGEGGLLSFFNSSSAETIAAALKTVKNGEIIAISGTVTFRDTTTELTKKYSKIARDINIESCAGIKLKGILDFGSTFNFGETDNGIETQYKLTKKNKTKDCSVLKVVATNNHSSNDLTVYGQTVAPGEIATIAQVSLLDLIKLYNSLTSNTTEELGEYYECTISDNAPAGSVIGYGSLPSAGSFVTGKSYSLGEILSKFHKEHDLEFINAIRNAGSGDYLSVDISTGVSTHETKYFEFVGDSTPNGTAVNMDDILAYVRWAKENEQGPWATNL